MGDWSRKDVWKKQSGKFCVEISRHTVAPSSIDPYEGVNRWAVYAYIYDNHRLFDKFEGTALFQDVTSYIPLHGGCSFLKAHRNDEGTVKCYQVGADYHHDRDDFTHLETKDDAYQIFNDAQELFEFLSEIQE